MAKGKKQSSKVQKKKGAKARPKVKKLSKATRGKAAANRAVAKAKLKRAPMKKAARPVAPAVETVAVEVIEQPAPGVITVTQHIQCLRYCAFAKAKTKDVSVP